MKKALITGVTGQDGSFLADFLLSKGYEVHGIVRRASTFNRERINHLSEEGSYLSDSEKKHFYTHYADLADSASVEKLLQEILPDEIYNLGAQSHVKISFDIPEYTANIAALGTLRLIEGIRKFCPKAKFYQASSSEMFGKVVEVPQNEKTPFYPRSPYGRAKLFAFWETVGAREAYNIFACNGILFNHESERRGENFVTKKITTSLSRIKLGLQKKMSLGNLNAERDWGHAKDYVESMWLMLQQDAPGDYVIGTGEKHSVREFLEEAAKIIGLNIHSNNAKGVDEKYLDEKGNILVEIDPQYFRPAEVDSLLADPSKAKRVLGWTPKIKFKELVRLMAENDFKIARNELCLKQLSKECNLSKINEIKKCRICGNEKLLSIIDIGSQPLSGRFPSFEEEKNLLHSPLELVRCDDSDGKSCGLLQLKHTVDLNEMYGETYGYRSSLNSTMTNHLNLLAGKAEKLVTLNSEDVVVDIGSSDGTLLKAYSAKNLVKFGIDPAAEKFSSYYPKDIKLVVDFFNAEKFKALSQKQAKIITSIAMFYDLENPLKFVADIKEILHPNGIWICEQSYMPRMLEMNSFDTICHEHLEYYSLKQIEYMLEKNNMRVFDIDFNDINGGSFRIYACHKDSPRESNKTKIQEVRDYEFNFKLNTTQPYEDFKQRVFSIKEKLGSFIRNEKSKGKKIHVYGASTKGNVLLNFLNLNNGLVEAAADRNPDKWGKITPGTKIPIISEEESRKANPDYYLVLPWHFKEEFLAREKDFLSKGGRFIFPLPNLEVIGNNY
jgi:GDP-mannose 4,6-dehydratase